MILILDSYILQSSTCFFCSGSIRSSNGALNTCHLTQNTPLLAFTEGLPQVGSNLKDLVLFQRGKQRSCRLKHGIVGVDDSEFPFFLISKRLYLLTRKGTAGTPWKIVPFFGYIISTKTCSWLLGESRAISFQGRFAIYGYSHCPPRIFHGICTQGHRSQWKSDWTAMGAGCDCHPNLAVVVPYDTP